MFSFAFQRKFFFSLRAGLENLENKLHYALYKVRRQFLLLSILIENITLKIVGINTFIPILKLRSRMFSFAFQRKFFFSLRDGSVNFENKLHYALYKVHR